MSLKDSLGRALVGDEIRLAREAAQSAFAELYLLKERLAELELAREDEGWVKLMGADDWSLSKTFLDDLARQARLYWLKNPLVKRAVETQTNYVFAQGMNIEARHEAVNAVVQAFLDDPKNQAELTRHQARLIKERELQIEGNLFLVFFVGESTGRVRLRSIRLREIADIITDPEDAKTSWFYKRVWTQKKINGHGEETREAYYPDFRYRPKAKPENYNGKPILWDNPVYHIKVNCLSDMKFGVPEPYAAIAWAKGYKEFLENWNSIIKSYSRFAWRMSVASAAAAIAAKAKIATTVGTGSNETSPPPVTGSVAIMPPGSTLEPIRTAGATVSAEDGRQLRLMVCAAMGIWDHYMGDPSTGNLATAKTMERPMEFQFLNRRALWADAFRDILDFVIDRSALAPSGPLDGEEVEGPDGEMDIVLANDTENPDPEKRKQPMDRTVDINFPPLLVQDMGEAMEALVKATTLGGFPPAGTFDLELATSIALDILQVPDKDEVMAELFPPEAEGEAPPFKGGEEEGMEGVRL